MHKHFLTLAAAVALSAIAPTAGAASLYGTGKDIAYAVQVDGQGIYKYHDNRGTADDPISTDINLTFDYRNELGDGVVFRNASPIDTRADDIPTGHAKGTYQETGGPACTVKPDDPAHGWARFVDQHEDDLLAPLDGMTHLWLRPLDEFTVSFACGDADEAHASHPTALLVMPFGDDAFDGKGNVKFGRNQMDIDWELPRDIVGMGYIEQLIPLHSYDGDKCPGWLNDQTISCHLEWTAKIIMKKIWQKPFKPGDPVPSADDDLLIPLVPPKKASLSRNGSKAKFSVSCWAGCSGRASVVAGAGGARARSASVPGALARTSFKLAVGATKDITMTLSARARRAVQRAGGARIVVETTSGGRPSLVSLPVRLRR